LDIVSKMETNEENIFSFPSPISFSPVVYSIQH
jgi:hypothetical protein